MTLTTNSGDQDAYIASIDTSFQFISSAQIGDGNNSDDQVEQIQLNSRGELVAAGYYSSSNSDFDPGSGALNASAHYGNEDAFVVSYTLGAAPPSCPVGDATGITGPTALCVGDENITYSTPVVSGATQYTWTFTGGPSFPIVSGQGTNQLVVDIDGDDPITLVVTPSDSTCSGDPDTIQLSANQLPALTSSVVQKPTCGADNGSVKVDVSGFDPFDYIWSNGDVSMNDNNAFNTISTLYSGGYTVTVTDNNNCSAQATVALNDDGAPSISSLSITDLNCADDGSGAIDLTVTGGTSPIRYKWSTGETTEDISGLEGGGYRVIILDSNDCRFDTVLLVDEPSPLNIIVSPLTISSCGGTSNASAIVEGAQGFTTITWSTGVNGNSATGLSAGVHFAYVVDGNSCTDTTYFAMTESGAPTIVLDSLIGQSCNQTNGGVYISLTGASSPSFTWSNNAGTEDISGLSTGRYSVVITDGSCTAAGVWDVVDAAPEVFPICLVTVDDTTTQNVIVWEKPYKTGIASFHIWRESWQANVFHDVFEIHVDSVSHFNDTLSNPRLKSWSYKLQVEDECGTRSALSEKHTTVHLVMRKDTTGSIKLNWNHYKGFNYNTYYIERFQFDSIGWELIDSVGADTNFYEDLTSNSQANLLYAIGVDHPNGCNSSRAAGKGFNSVRSNRSVNVGNAQTYLDTSDTNTTIFEWSFEDYSISIYPNPNAGQFKLQVKGEKPDLYELRIRDALGREVWNQQGFSSESSQQIDFQRNAPGVYFLEFIPSSGNLKTIRLVVH